MVSGVTFPVAPLPLIRERKVGFTKKTARMFINISASSRVEVAGTLVLRAGRPFFAAMCMAFIRLLRLAVMLSVLVVPGWSGVLATDDFVDDRDERCSGKCSAAALEGVHLLFAFNLYHSTLSDAAAMQAAADTAVQPGVRTFDAAATERSPSGILKISELTRQFLSLIHI